jgi:para-nitrobenzyl esterase
MVALLALAGCGDNLLPAQDDAGSPVEAAPQGDAAPDTAPLGPAVVETTYGPVRGELHEGYRVFRGIPYAAPPVGDLRFAPPQPVTPWTEERDATRFGSDCPQDWPTVTSDTPEDCLFLNIYAPDPLPAEPMPVVVWLHGGDNINGGAAMQWYHGEHLAQRGQLLVVTLNYRLGVLGYLSHPAFGATSGNWGFLDQQAALRWVRDTIGAFGGDKDNVTLAGLGSGASHICVHLASPTSAGLFHRASMESAFGICGAEVYAHEGSEFWQGQAQADLQGGRVAAAVGCDTAADVAACLRSKDEAELRHSVAPPDIVWGTGEFWGSHSGTPDVPKRPIEAIEANTFNKVPIILATVRDETSSWFRYAQDMTEAWALSWNAAAWGSNAQAIVDRYPFADYGSAAKTVTAVSSDVFYSCPYRRVARDLAAWEAPVWFIYSPYAPTSAGDPFLGAFEASLEVLLFHQDLDTCAGCNWRGKFTPEEHQLSLDIMDYWIRFARTGDPNGDGAYAWPKLQAGLEQHLVVGVPFSDAQDFHEELCDFFEGLY